MDRQEVHGPCESRELVDTHLPGNDEESAKTGPERNGTTRDLRLDPGIRSSGGVGGAGADRHGGEAHHS